MVLYVLTLTGTTPRGERYDAAHRFNTDAARESAEWQALYEAGNRALNASAQQMHAVGCREFAYAIAAG